MDNAQWSAVDQYINDTLVQQDDVLLAALRDSDAAGLPAISVAPNQGKLLNLLARMQGARRILEIGTLGGYSTIWLARALDAAGQLVSLELDAHHAEVARVNVERAGLSEIVEIRVGPARESLAALQAEGCAPFDLVFIDADKVSIPDYFTASLELARRGSMIIVDNVVRSGAVADAQSADASVLGVRRFNDMVAADSRVTATTLQTVGSKGYDGLTFVLVTDDTGNGSAR
jgi:predicted O-methyltransferase YrrM